MTGFGIAPLILASTSIYRRELLQRLKVPFEVVPPEVDETPLPAERPADLARRLALAKAQAIAQSRPKAIVIGSDQVADLHGDALGKPGSFDKAMAQLQRMSGQTVIFHTAVSVVFADRQFFKTELAQVHVQFRKLSSEVIESYLKSEQPYDCAGSAKSEGLGIALLERIDSDDPTALIGLPLIRTCQLLRQAGLPLL